MQLTSPTNSKHAVQFYETEEFLCEHVADFLIAGLAAGEGVVVIATESHRRLLIDRLTAQGIDVATECHEGHLELLDARDILRTFMIRDRPDRERFETVLGPFIEHARENCVSTHVRAYGEMVDVLWQAGNIKAAHELEALWTELGQYHGFELLCAYTMKGFHDEAGAAAFSEICKHHELVGPLEPATTAESGPGFDHMRALVTEITRRQDVETQLRETIDALHKAKAEAERHVEREREQLARAKEVIRERDEFLSIVSHELKTPLTSLQLQLQSLLERVGDCDPKIIEKVGKSIKSGDRLAQLIESLLDVSRIATGRFTLSLEHFDFGTVVRETLDRFRDTATKAGCSFLTNIESPLIGSWDRHGIGQVVASLLSNAIKYGSGAPIELYVARDEGDVVVAVRDHGPGISAGDVERVFERFERAVSFRNYGGFGLGLYVIREIAQAHGGTVSVEPALGGGARFAVRIPLGN